MRPITKFCLLIGLLTNVLAMSCKTKSTAKAKAELYDLEENPKSEKFALAASMCGLKPTAIADIVKLSSEDAKIAAYLRSAIAEAAGLVCYRYSAGPYGRRRYYEEWGSPGWPFIVADPLIAIELPLPPGYGHIEKLTRECAEAVKREL